MDEDRAQIVGIEDAATAPYSLALSYPHVSRETAASRIEQLRTLGITQLSFLGRMKIDGLAVLGKGVAGIVVLGFMGQRRVALKVRRSDSRRENLTKEAEMLRAANDAGIGPEYFGNTQDVLAMEFVEGSTLPLWLSNLKGRGQRTRTRAMTRSLMEQCYVLDCARLDHGELSRAHKNVLVSADDRPFILDFESASNTRRVRNVTAITQYLFIGGFSRRVSRVIGPIEKARLRTCLRLYKRELSEESFGAVLEMIGR